MAKTRSFTGLYELVQKAKKHFAPKPSAPPSLAQTAQDMVQHANWPHHVDPQYLPLPLQRELMVQRLRLSQQMGHALDANRYAYEAYQAQRRSQIYDAPVAPLTQLFEHMLKAAISTRLVGRDGVVTVRRVAPPGGFMRGLDVWIGDCLLGGIPTQVSTNPPAGFRDATNEELDCADCVSMANKFLLRRGWMDGRHDPQELCRRCLRSPTEYFLAHTPEHAVWFERSVMLANANTGDGKCPSS